MHGSELINLISLWDSSIFPHPVIRRIQSFSIADSLKDVSKVQLEVDTSDFPLPPQSLVDNLGVELVVVAAKVGISSTTLCSTLDYSQILLEARKKQFMGTVPIFLTLSSKLYGCERFNVCL